MYDARTAPRAKVCGEGLHPSGRALIEDLIGDISELGFDLTGFEFFTPSGRLLGLDHPSKEVGLGCDRFLLDQRLWEELERSPEVDFIPGETVRGLERSRSGWFVRTTSGVVPTNRVVAADGVGSRLRWSTRRSRGRRHGRWGLRRRFQGAARTPTRVQIFFCGEGEIYVTPLAEGRVNVAVLGHEEFVRGLQDSERLSSFLEPVEVLRGAEPEDEISILPHRGERSRVLCRDRLYMVGDAAIFLDPISGAGMSVAACSAHIIGTHLAAVLAGACTDEESEARAEKQLRSMIRPYRRMTRLLRLLSVSSTVRWGTTKFLKGAPKVLDRLARPTHTAWAKEQVASI